MIIALAMVGSYALLEVQGHSYGITGQTQKPSSAASCGNGACHSTSANSATTVTITTSSGSSPLTVSPSTAYTFSVRVANGSSSQVAAGTDIATYSGTGLAPSNSDLYSSSSELTHGSPKSFSGLGYADFSFTYTSGSTTGWDTIYANGNAVNGNGSADAGDIWNYATKFIIHTVVPANVKRFAFGRTSMSLGNVRVGLRKADSLKIASTGQNAITINSNGIKGGAPFTFYTAGTSGRLLAPAASETDSVIFQPTSRGSFSDSVIFTTNSDTIPDQRKGMYVTGNGIQGVFSNALSTLAFGNLRINQTKKMAFPFYNSGDDTVFISTPTISGSGFTITQQPHGSFLIPNAYDTVIVQFAPVAKQSYSGSLSFSAANGVTAPTISLSGTGIVPQITFTSPQGIGGIRVGTSLPATVPIHNTGTDTLHLSAVTMTQTGTKFTLGAYDATLAPGANGLIHLTYLPTAERIDSATLHLTTDDPTSNFPTILVIGSGLLPHMSLVDHDTIDMGTIKVGDASSRQFTINNNGGDVLTISNSTAAGPSPFLLLSKSATVAAGGSGFATVSFAPLASGSFTGSLMVVGDDPNNPSDTIFLKGSAINSALSITPSSVDFGSVPVGSTIYDTIVLSNTGTAAVNIISYRLLSTTGGFIVVDSSAKSVGAQKTATIIVAFAPDSAGGFNGFLSLTTDDNSAPTRTISLTGRGLKGSLSIAPTTLDFGLVDSSKSSMMHFALINTGGASVGITSVSLTPAGTNFTSTAPSTATVKAGDSLGVDVTFAPKSAGAQSGKITFTLDDKSTLTVNLTGTGRDTVTKTGGTTGVVALHSVNGFSIQLSPNPAKDMTTVQISMAQSSTATVRLFDARGNEVRVTPLGMLSAGAHATDLLTSRLTSGSYFVRIEDGNGGVAEARLVIEH